MVTTSEASQWFDVFSYSSFGFAFGTYPSHQNKEPMAVLTKSLPPTLEGYGKSFEGFGQL